MWEVGGGGGIVQIPSSAKKLKLYTWVQILGSGVSRFGVSGLGLGIRVMDTGLTCEATRIGARVWVLRARDNLALAGTSSCVRTADDKVDLGALVHECTPNHSCRSSAPQLS